MGFDSMPSMPNADQVKNALEKAGLTLMAAVGLSGCGVVENASGVASKVFAQPGHAVVGQGVERFSEVQKCEGVEATYSYKVSLYDDPAQPGQVVISLSVAPQVELVNDEKVPFAQDLQVLKVGMGHDVGRVRAMAAKGSEGGRVLDVETQRYSDALNWIMYAKKTDKPFHLFIGNEKAFHGQDDFPIYNPSDTAAVTAAFKHARLFNGLLQPVGLGASEQWTMAPGAKEPRGGDLARELAGDVDWKNATDVLVDPEHREVVQQANMIFEVSK